jgi:hypothetical protein
MRSLYRDCQDAEPAIAEKFKKEKNRNRFYSRAALIVGIISVSMIFYFNFSNSHPQAAAQQAPSQITKP